MQYKINIAWRELKETPLINWKIPCPPITFGVSEKRLPGRIFDEKRSNTTPTLVNPFVSSIGGEAQKALLSVQQR
ncbi:hypothetical protein T02_5677 [Trichinella nativa]|uniref:Uncharacterized protein n=1 Tax=Trichinella nativa TaxID=6335 RepID=A0A0V1KNE7_9BILA|nr:hypothetical protein T02_5677 [Trichinella nativa]